MHFAQYSADTPRRPLFNRTAGIARPGRARPGCDKNFFLDDEKITINLKYEFK